MKPRTLVYARVSTEDQVEKYGLPSQLRACGDFAKTRGLEVIEKITDDGISGTILDRPGLDRVRQIVREGKVDVVLMLDVDRLSRELAHLLILKPEIERHAQLEFVTAKFEDSPSGRMFFGIRGVIAQYEREQTRERTMRGKRERARAGLIVGGRVAYGYRYDKGSLFVDEPRAAVVRTIFALYDGGASIRSITRQLRETGAPTSRGQKWGHSSVRRILVNETYSGIAHYGTHRREGTVLRVRHGGERIALSVPPIVDRSQWERVQARLAENPMVGRPSSGSLMRGILYCSVCNRRMHGERTRKSSSYRCAGRDTLRHSGERCRVQVGVEKLDAAVWAALLKTFLDTSALRAALQQRERELRSADPSQIEQLRSQVARLRRKEEAALNAMLDPDLVAGRTEIKLRYRTTVDERRRIEAELTRLAQSQRTFASTDQWLDETVALIGEYMQALTGNDKRQEFVRKLVERAEWNGEEVRMRCFIDAQLSTSSIRCARPQPLLRAPV